MKIILIISILFVAVIGNTNIFAKTKNEITFTILYDNYVYDNSNCKEDWGFSCLIEGLEKKILFDTGTKSDLFMENISKLHAKIDDVDLIVISHNHGDHTGGLLRFLEENHNVSVYMPYSTSKKDVEQIKQKKAKVLQSEKPIEICKDVYLTGEMGITPKEQSLVINTSTGLIVITGCAHPGILNIVKKSKEIIDKEIQLVFGGFHLMQHNATQIDKIIAGFHNIGVQKVGATHCTGDLAIKKFKEDYKENYVQMGVGRILKVTK